MCKYQYSWKYFLTFYFLLLTGCSKSNIQSVIEQIKSTSIVPAAAEVLRQKPLANLGNTETLAKFQLADANAIRESKPRPTEPVTLAILAGNPPLKIDICNLPYSALINAMYQKCFPEGISYIKMSNIIGWSGEEIARSKDTVSYRWAGGKQSNLSATFVNGALTEKSQVGLK